MSTNNNGKSVKIGDTEMYYVSFGSGSRTLVVLPGLSDGLATVKGKKAFLSAPYMKYMKDYTIYVFSRKNDMPEGYSIIDMAHDQTIAMKELGIKKAFLMGVSQGGMISQYLAADYPDMIEGLILAGFTKPKGYTRFFRNAYAILDFDARAVLPKYQLIVMIIIPL